MDNKVLATYRKAYHEYAIHETYEAGIALQGTEVKALRSGKANLSEGWVSVANGEAVLRELHISHYSHGNIMNHAETRERKLLLNRNELIKLEEKVAHKGFSIIPLQIYFKGRFIKVEIALAKGKKQYDKRESEKEKQSGRDIARAMRRE